MNYTTFQNLAIKKYTRDSDSIKEEIKELLYDFEQFQEDFADTWFHENEDWLGEDGINEESFNEMFGECVEAYSFNHCYSNLFLSDQTFRFIKLKLPEDTRRLIDHQIKMDGYEDTGRIVYYYLNIHRRE